MRVWLEATDISHEAFSLVLDSLPYTLRPQGRETKKEIQVTIAQGLHLFPFRTEKLNLVTPMVLRKRESR